MASAPPAYETPLNSFSRTGPLGTPEHLELAAKLVRNGARVLAAVPMSKRASEILPWQTIRTCAVLPCLWPCLLLASPCLVPGAKAHERTMQNIVYVVTSESIITHIADHDAGCCACCTTGRDYSELPLESITSVSVNNSGQGCGSCAVPSVTVSMPSMGVATGSQGGRHGGRHGGRRGHRGHRHGRQGHTAINAGVHLYVEDPDAIGELIRNARAQIKSEAQGVTVAQLAGLILQQPAAVAVAAAPAPAPTKRIFVALSTAPTAFSIFNVQESKTESFESLLMEIRATFSIEKSAPVQLALADVNAVVTNIESLSSNDKLIATVA